MVLGFGGPTERIMIIWGHFPPNHLLLLVEPQYTTMVTEVKLDYFRGYGSTTAVAVKNQV